MPEVRGGDDAGIVHALPRWKERGRSMPSDFRIDCRRDRDALHVHLLGDFDEKSANALIHTLKTESGDASVVFIRARDVGRLEASACDSFKRKVPVLRDGCYRLVFMDQNSILLRPDWLEIF